MSECVNNNDVVIVLNTAFGKYVLIILSVGNISFCFFICFFSYFMVDDSNIS